LLDIWDTSTRQQVVMVPQRNWEGAQMDLSSTGVSQPCATPGPFWPVAAQPSTTAAIRIVSSQAGDGTGEQIAIRGLNSSDEVIEETLTANGLTQVTSTSTFKRILNVTKVGTWAGTMTMSTVADGTLLTLTATQYAKQYPTLLFIEPPASAVTYSYSFLRVPRTLSLDRDIPEIPFPFSEILVYDTLLDLCTYNAELGAKHARLWDKRFDELWKQLAESADEVIAGAQPRFVRDLDGVSGRPMFQFT
jgi:hypothetical protein